MVHYCSSVVVKYCSKAMRKIVLHIGRHLRRYVWLLTTMSYILNTYILSCQGWALWAIMAYWASHGLGASGVRQVCIGYTMRPKTLKAV